MKHMASSDEDITKLNTEISTIKSKLGIMEEKVGILDGKVSSLEARIGKFDTNNQSYGFTLFAVVIAVAVIAYLIWRYTAFISEKNKLLR
jgi:hypothetical protein